VPSPLHLALDLGAGSGRALVGSLGSGGLVLREVHRFRYEPRPIEGRLRWDMDRLTAGLRDGIAHAAVEANAMRLPLASVGVDSWGVDYGLIDAEGRLVEEPICYRDERTSLVMDEVFARVPRHELFALTGIQVLALNTLFQLAAHVRDGLPPGTARLLMIPDLCHHRLCGSTTTELTNASTTQLLDADRSGWNDELFRRLGLPRRIMPDVVTAGTRLGALSAEWQAACGVGPLDVVAPATHDTGSAVAGTPLEEGWAYISSGTWSLLGIEREHPLIDDDVARANFTNEAGVFGTTRFLKNVMGLWILESCRREWERAGLGLAYDDLLGRAAAVADPAGFIYPDDERFFNPPSMVEAVRGSLAEHGWLPHEDPILLTRVVLDSLALRYASLISTIEALTGRMIPGIHIVGGGSLNAYLNQATADASARPVIAGPAEATAIGNLAVQAIAGGELGALADARRLLTAHLPLRRYEPRHVAAWRAAAREYEQIEQGARLPDDGT
jgi:rhamnulokinase